MGFGTKAKYVDYILIRNIFNFFFYLDFLEINCNIIQREKVNTQSMSLLK